MDFSWDYIHMNITARELQLQRPDYWEAGDFYYCGGSIDGSNTSIPIWDVAISNYENNGQKERRESYQVWLPRLDQLAELLQNWNHKISLAFFQHVATNSLYHPVPISIYTSFKKCIVCHTLEQHIMHMLMWEQYHKVWDVETKNWYVYKG